jgi:uncharacterized protein YkwD
MRRCAAVVAVAAVSVAVSVAPAAADTETVTSDAALVRQLASELNAARREAGKPGVRYSQALATAAAARARRLAAQGWASAPLAGTALRRAVGASYAGRVGETVLWADGKICGSAVVYYWLDKLRDRTTVLASRWTEAGIAAVRAGGDTFVVVEYGAGEA